MDSFHEQHPSFFPLIYEDWDTTIETHDKMLAKIIKSEVSYE